MKLTIEITQDAHGRITASMTGPPTLVSAREALACDCIKAGICAGMEAFAKATGATIAVQDKSENHPLNPVGNS